MDPDIRAERVLEELTCPVLHEPLSEAVTLVPCGHKVQEAAAVKMYGPVHSWTVEGNAKCPVCVRPVKGYIKDYLTRSVVAHLAGLSPKELQMVSNTIRHLLPEHSAIVPDTVYEELPYPGIPGKFVHTGGDWKSSNHGRGSALQKQLNFDSRTPDSWIQNISVLNYGGNKNAISIEIRKTPNYSPKNITDFFAKLGIDIKFSEAHLGTIVVRGALVKVLFKLVAENNEIPEPYYSLIRAIVEKSE